MEIPPLSKCGERVVGVTLEGFRALKRQMYELEEKICRVINLSMIDEGDDEEEVENVEKGEILNPKRRYGFQGHFQDWKRPKVEVPTILINLSPK